MEETKIFKILKFAAEKEVFKGIHLIEGTGLPWDELRRYASVAWPQVSVAKEGIFEREGGTYLPGTPDRDEKEQEFQVTYAAMMHWIDYVELKEARESSRRAHKVAVASIGIGVVAIAIAVWLGVFRTATVKLDAAQAHEFIEAIRSR